MRFHKSTSTNGRSCLAPNRRCAVENQCARFTAPKCLPWLLLVIVGLMFSVDFLAAAQQKRMLEVTVTRHIMAALQQDADKPIDQSLRAHWITPDADGNVDGRISSLDSETAEASPIGFLTVTLMEKGQQVSKAKTDKEGRFVLESVEPGVYTLLAYGKSGFLAYGVHVLPRLEELDLDEEIDLGEELNADPDGVEGIDLNVRNSADRTPLSVKQRQAMYVSHFNLPVGAVVAEELKIDAAAVPPEFTALRKISQNYLSASSAFSILADKDDLKGIAKASLTSGGFQFSLSPDGHFHGRLQPIATEGGKPTKLSDMNLFLIQDDVEILRVAAEENGDFRMDDVEPGVYSLIAAGEDGFAALSLELVSAEGDDAAEDGGDANAGNNRNDGGSNIVRRVSTAAKNPAPRQEGQPAVNIPALGIAIVTDREDLKMINKTVERVARANLVQNRPPIEGFNGGNLGGFNPGGFAPGGFAPGGFAPGGFSPGGFASAPSSFAPAGITPAAAPLTPSLGSAGLSLGGSAGGLLGVAGLIGGVVAIADDTSSPPPAATPSTIGS